MGVVCAVTAIAGRRQYNFRDRLGAVARMAVQVLVSARQREMRLRGMIEPPPRPAIWIMAARTRLGQAAFVTGILVTATASLRSVLEAWGLVALFTGHRGM